MKTAISIPDPMFAQAEQFAKQRKMSRSAVYAAALSDFLERHRELNVTEQLNAVYPAEKSEVEPENAMLQTRSVAREAW